MSKVFILLVAVLSLQAQVTFKNQLEFTHWSSFPKQIKSGSPRNYWVNWSDVTYQKRGFKMGLRYEVNTPPDPFIFPADSLVARYQLTYGFVHYKYRKWSFTVGHFYEMFGRGLTLRTYEDRNLRVDNNIQGARVTLNRRFIKWKVLAGRMRDKYNRRQDWLYGTDLEWRALRELHLGGSYLLKDNQGQKSALAALRLNWLQDNWDLYLEVARPQNPSLSYYMAMNGYLGDWSITLELKDYNQLSFTNAYGTEYNAAPSLTREHSFSLLNRHPHALNQNDEKGYQVEVTYALDEESSVIVNHSHTFDHQNRRLFQEFYAEWQHNGLDVLEYHLAAAWTFDFSTNTENITPVVDGSYNVTEKDQIHLSYQHQHTKNRSDLSEYDNEFLLVEYSRSPYLSLALVAEYTNKYQLVTAKDMKRHFWIYGNLSLSLWQNQRLSLLYGSRREGFICVGGICRYEPEFEGLEIKLTTRF